MKASTPFSAPSIDEEDIDTIGGWFMTQRFEAIQGEKIFEQGYELMVKDVEGHHILYLEVIKLDEEETEVIPDLSMES